MTERLRTILAVIMLLLASAVSAQMPIKFDVARPVAPDSVDSVRLNKKAFWRASAEVVGMNLSLWAFDRYVQHGDFAYISWNTIKENFKHGFEWDNDKLGTNTFLHPYNGNLYFNAGRSNGFNFWQSELYAIGGSAMWEMFMEREYPSTNDIIATPIGGAAIGEVLYRGSDLLVDDRLTGWERFGRELGIFLVSPVRGFTRIVTGRAWAHRATSGRRFGTPPIAVQFMLGTKMLQSADALQNTYFGGSASVDVEYGNRFDLSSKAPYDYFTFSLELQAMSTQPLLNRLQIKGRLLGREFLETRSTHLSVGLYQHFDFFDSDSTKTSSGRVPYKLGIPASVGGGLLFRDVERKNWVLDAYLHTNLVLLGGILSDYYRYDERNYNWASGFSIKSGVNFVYKRDMLSLSLAHELYRLFTWSDYVEASDAGAEDPVNVAGDRSAVSFNRLTFRFNLKVWKHLYATFIFGYYHRSTRYHFMPDVRSSTLVTKIGLTYKL